MQLTVTTIIFGLPTGQRLSYVQLTLPAARLAMRELIAYKVRQEVEEYLTHQRSGLSGDYLSPEELLGAASSAAPGAVGHEIVRAQQGFAARAYMIVVNNRRVWDLEDTFTLDPTTQVEFIKILPLVGG